MPYIFRHNIGLKPSPAAQKPVTYCSQNWTNHSLTYMHPGIAVFEKVEVSFLPAK